MNTRPFVRLAASIALMLGVLASIIVILGQIQFVRAARTSIATDYTVGGPCGATIQACINNQIVQPGDRILIPAGMYTESLTLNKAISLLGVGATDVIIHAVTAQRVLTVTGGTITETTVISGLTFTGGRAVGNQFPHLCPLNCGGGILITDSARPLIVNSDVISNFAFNAGGGIAIYSDLPVTLIGVRWISNTWGAGAGLYVEGQARIINGRFEDNWGGGIYAVGSLTLSNTDFFDNVYGGLSVSGTATIQGGRFENNVSAAGGGAQVIGILNVTGTRFISNSATSYQPGNGGGGVYVLGTATIANARFEHNYSHYYGGGLRGDVVYFDNTAQFSTVTLQNTDFISNTADFFGGGVAVGGTTSIQGGQFNYNHSGDIVGDGGGLDVYGSLVIHNAWFIDNTTAGNGGAIGQRDRVFAPASDAQIVNTLFAGNQASVSGAALSTRASGTTTILQTTIADMDINPKEAIAVITGTVGITNTIITNHSVAISQTGGASVYQDYNLFFSNTLTQTGGVVDGGHSLNGDPHFANPSIDNYHVLSPSAAIDAGINAGVFSDLDGLPRPLGAGFDIGAYEYADFPNHSYLPLVVKNH